MDASVLSCSFEYLVFDRLLFDSLAQVTENALLHFQAEKFQRLFTERL